MKKYRTTKMAKGGKPPMKPAVRKMANGGKAEPPKGTRSAGSFVRIQDPDLREAYSTVFTQQYGPIEKGLSKLTPAQRETLADRAEAMASRRFKEERDAAADKMEFETQAYQSGRYEPGQSFRPREAQGNPADLMVLQAEERAIRNARKISPELLAKYGVK